MNIDNTSVIKPALYVIATPIGNIYDISIRAQRLLSDVDIIAAEDTRTTKILLDKLGIMRASSQQLISCHDHNEEQRSHELIQRIKDGASVALVSDAGTPLMSDPGYRVVKHAHEHDVPVIPVPGACAAIAALSAAGLPTDQFKFWGFIPVKGSKRQHIIRQLRQETATSIFYESPRRIQRLLAEISQTIGSERLCVYARELTKTYETIKLLTLGELADFVSHDSNQQKGEIVLIIAGAEESVDLTSAEGLNMDAFLNALLNELPINKAAKVAAKATGINKKNIYDAMLRIQKES